MNIDLFLKESHFKNIEKEQATKNITKGIMEVNESYPYMRDFIMNDDYLNHQMERVGLMMNFDEFEEVVFKNFGISIEGNREDEEIRVKETGELFEDYLNRIQDEYTITVIFDCFGSKSNVFLEIGSNYVLFNELLVRVHDFNTVYDFAVVDPHTFMEAGEKEYEFSLKEKEFFTYHIDDILKGRIYGDVRNGKDEEYVLFKNYTLHDIKTEKQPLETIEKFFISSWKNLSMFLKKFHLNE